MRSDKQPAPELEGFAEGFIVAHDETEARYTKRKTDFMVLPCVILMFMFLQFDRTSLGNALTDNFARTNGLLVPADTNLGQTLFTLGMVLLELPSNLVAKILGPSRWIPFIMVIWGVVTLCQAFIKDRAGFLATRFLLAAGEAGFIPGMVWYLSRLYPNGDLGLRFACFWGANSIAGIVSGPLALGLLSLGKTGSLHGWQYLFLIEGGLTVVVAIFAFFWLPVNPMDGGRSLLGRIIYTERQAEVVASVVVSDDPKKALPRGAHVTMRDFVDTFKTWGLYGHCAAAFLSSVMLTPINTYGPSIVKNLGYAGYTANAMQAPGAAIALIVSLSLAWHSDRVRERGLHIALVMALSSVGCFWLAFAPTSVSRNTLYGGYIFTVGFMGTGQAINAAWLTSRLEERLRPVALACYVMSIQLAGFAGANVFKAKDAPRYRHGLAICGGCVLAASVVMVTWKFLYIWADKRTASTAASDAEIESVPHVHDSDDEKK